MDTRISRIKGIYRIEIRELGIREEGEDLSLLKNRVKEKSERILLSCIAKYGKLT